MKKNKLAINTTKKKIVSPKNLKGFREADLIIAYLEDRNASTTLPKKVQDDYERYMIVHSMLMRYQQHSAVIGFLRDKFGRTERQARQDINETQYVFGKMIQVNRDYELAYLREISRKNIEIAVNTKNTKNITMALKAHLEILGPEMDNTLLPDFSNLEPHKYSIVLPKDVQDQLSSLLKSGAINLSEAIPSRMLKLKMDDIEDAEVIP